MKNCPKCNAKNTDNALFCSTCGSSFSSKNSEVKPLDIHSKKSDILKHMRAIFANGFVSMSQENAEIIDRIKASKLKLDSLTNPYTAQLLDIAQKNLISYFELNLAQELEKYIYGIIYDMISQDLDKKEFEKACLEFVNDKLVQQRKLTEASSTLQMKAIQMIQEFAAEHAK